MKNGLHYAMDAMLVIRIFSTQLMRIGGTLAGGEAAARRALVLQFHHIRQFAGHALFGMHTGVLLMLCQRRHGEEAWPTNVICIIIIHCTAVNPVALNAGLQIYTPDGAQRYSEEVTE